MNKRIDHGFTICLYIKKHYFFPCHNTVPLIGLWNIKNFSILKDMVYEDMIRALEHKNTTQRA